MKKILTFIGIFGAFLLPLAANAITVSWVATSTDKGYIAPNTVSGNNPFVSADHYIATSTSVASQFPYASTTAISVTTAYLKDPIADVRSFGAKPDGVTDNTTAIQTALNTFNNVYIPVGTFVVSNITLNPGQHLYGAGASSTLAFKAGSTGFMIEANQNTVSVEDLSLDGGNNINMNSTSASSTLRSGLHVSQLSTNSVIDNLSIHGFGNEGLAFNGNGAVPNNFVTPPTVSKVNAYYNYIGIDTGYGLASEADTQRSGEYITFTNINASQNRYGIRIASGNTFVSASNFSNNGYGVSFVDVINNSHGSLTNNSINHNTVYGLYASSTQIGESIIGNQSFFGDWYLNNVTGFNIQGNSFGGSMAINLINGGTNYLKGNFFYTTPVINRTTDNTIISDNFYGPTATYALDKRDLVVDSNVAYINSTLQAPIFSATTVAATSTFAGNIALGGANLGADFPNSFSTGGTGLGVVSATNNAMIGVKSKSSTGYAFFDQGNDNGSDLLFGTYGSTVAGSWLGVSKASNSFELTTQNQLAIGTLDSHALTLGTNNAAALTISSAGAITFPNISGSTQCLHVNSSGLVSGTGSDCGSGGSSASTTLLSDNNTFSGANTFKALNYFNGNPLIDSSSILYFPNDSQLADTSGNLYADTGSIAINNVGQVFVGAGVNPPTNGDCLNYSNTNGISDAGAPCGSGSGGGIQDPFTHPASGQSATTSLMISTGGYLSSASSTLALFNSTNSTTTNATTTKFFATTASTTNLFGAGLASCNSGSNALTWNAGKFGCNSISGGAGAAYPFGLAGNATSTLTQFNGGLTAYASSTLSLLTSINSTSTNATTTILSVTTASSSSLTVDNGVTIGASGSLKLLYAAGTGNNCATINNSGFLQNIGSQCLLQVNSPNSTLSVSAISSNTQTLDLNLSHGNVWTASTTFAGGLTSINSTSTNATTTNFSATNASSTNMWDSSLGTPAGTFLAVDPTGKLVATSTPINTSGSTEGVQWATAGVLGGTPTYSNGSSGVGATLTEIGTGALSVDGNSPAVNDRVLVKNQASAFQNGIYVVTATGSGIASYILTRTTDYNQVTEITPGITTYVVNGATNNDDTFAVSYTSPLTIGTTNLTYTEVSGGGAAVTSVSNGDGSLTISPTAGAVVGSLNVTHPNTWTGLQTLNGGASSTGEITAVTASSTNLIIGGITGSTQCLHTNSSGVVSGTGSDCGSGGGGGSAYPFTTTTNFGTTTSATTTAILAPVFFASSTSATSTFANGINLSNKGCYAKGGNCITTSTTIGSATYNLTSSFADVGSDMHLTLPGAGTYFISASGTFQIGTSGDVSSMGIFDVTNSIGIGQESPMSSTGSSYYYSDSDIATYTVTGPTVISIEAKNNSAARGQFLNSFSKISFVGPF